jgi:hypothetical protein
LRTDIAHYLPVDAPVDLADMDDDLPIEDGVDRFIAEHRDTCVEDPECGLVITLPDPPQLWDYLNPPIRTFKLPDVAWPITAQFITWLDASRDGLGSALGIKPGQLVDVRNPGRYYLVTFPSRVGFQHPRLDYLIEIDESGLFLDKPPWVYGEDAIAHALTYKQPAFMEGERVFDVFGVGYTVFDLEGYYVILMSDAGRNIIVDIDDAKTSKCYSSAVRESCRPGIAIPPIPYDLGQFRPVTGGRHRGKVARLLSDDGYVGEAFYCEFAAGPSDAVRVEHLGDVVAGF